MQIQNLSISAQYQYSSISQTSASQAGVSAAQADETGEAQDSVLADEPKQVVTRTESFQQSLELIFRAQFESTQQVEHGDSGRGRRGNRDTREGLRDVRKAVKYEIRELAKQLAGINSGNTDQVQGQDLGHEINDVGKEFDRAIKDLEHGTHDGELSDPAEVIEAIQGSFEQLFSRIESNFGTQRSTEAPAIDAVLPEALADFVDRIQTLISELSQSMANRNPESMEGLEHSEQQMDNDSELIPFSAPAQEAVSSYTSFSFEMSISISGSSFSTAA